MHYKKVKGILSANNVMNIYRGCSHGCIYCDSRSKCYQMDHPFEDIEVKINALELLEKALMSKRNKCMIATGSMTDPYMPLEKEIQYTRKALEIIDKYGFGLTIITKSNLILRDLDLLASINKKAKCVVQITLTTHDENLCKILEPNVCTTKERFETLKTLNEHGIPTIVWFSPILPFINDTEENLYGILDYCVKAKVQGIIFFGISMTLREGSREYYYKKLDEHFPGLKSKYIKTYRDAYIISSPNNERLTKILKKECTRNNIILDNQKLFSYLQDFPIKYKQISIFD